jgi:hypothetical protein
MSENPVTLTHIKRDDMLVLLKRSGSRKATAETIEADIQAGAPVNNDGTINLIEYAAWLVKETNGI